MSRLLATVALGPVLFAQGIYVWRNIVKLPEPPGEREGVSGTGKKLSLLILGDSAAAGVGAPTLDDAFLGQALARITPTHQVEYALVAKSGATTTMTIKHLAKRPQARFDVVGISLGVNDVIAGTSVAAWRAQVAELAELLREKFGAKRMYFMAMPPVSHFPALPQPLRWYLGSQAERFDAALEEFANEHSDCERIEQNLELDVSVMAEDMFHPGPRVYAQWGQDLADRVLSAENGKGI